MRLRNRDDVESEPEKIAQEEKEMEDQIVHGGSLNEIE